MSEHARLVAAADDGIGAIEQRFWSMHKASRQEPPPTGAERKHQLRGLRDMVSDHARDFAHAIARDFGWRSHDETLLAEVVPTLGNIKDALTQSRSLDAAGAAEPVPQFLARAQPRRTGSPRAWC